ncbi:hypothetical protein ROZALSC1DRAFT_26299, partial [Rozella allomycis CSF55]
EERNNWQNVQEQAIRELVDSNTCSGHVCAVTNCNENSEVRCTTCVDHPKFCRVHGEKHCRVDISCMVIDTKQEPCGTAGGDILLRGLGFWEWRSSKMVLDTCNTKTLIK